MHETYRGSCFCGAVEIEATGSPLEMGYCHCSSCRAYGGAPFTAFALWRAADVTVMRGADRLRNFNKAGMTERRFCSRCGGHVMAHHPGLGLADIHPATLPTLVFRPSVHLNYAETVFPVRDGLPKLKDFPAHAGGSGEALPE